MVFASSMLVCRNGYIPRSDDDYCPNTLYGQSKVSGELVVRGCRELAGRWTIVRPTSIWGPWCGPPYLSFFLSLARGRYWHPGSGNPPKAFGYVGNTTYQIVRLLTARLESVAGRTFYLADNPGYSIRDFATAIQVALRTKPIRELPLWLLRPTAALGDVLMKLGWNNPPLTSFRLSNMLTGSQFDLRDLHSITGQLPFSLSEGVSETISWLRTSGAIR
jgi:nucleoside-diphosphate-sugar epimerase